MYPLDRDLPCILIDLDGTLFDNQHRAELVPAKEDWNKPEAWAAYEHAAINDTVCQPILNLVRQLHHAGFVNLVYCTARFANHYRIALAQLHKARLLKESRQELYMRNIRTDGPQQTPGEFKAGVVQTLRDEGLDVAWAIDDSPSVIAALEEIGVKTFRVKSLCSATAIETAGEADNLAEEKAAHRQTKDKMGRVLLRDAELTAKIERMEVELNTYREGPDSNGVRAAADVYFMLREELNLPQHAPLVDYVMSMKEELDQFKEAKNVQKL